MKPFQGEGVMKVNRYDANFTLLEQRSPGIFIESHVFIGHNTFCFKSGLSIQVPIAFGRIPFFFAHIAGIFDGHGFLIHEYCGVSHEKPHKNRNQFLSAGRKGPL